VVWDQRGRTTFDIVAIRVSSDGSGVDSSTPQRDIRTSQVWTRNIINQALCCCSTATRHVWWKQTLWCRIERFHPLSDSHVMEPRRKRSSSVEARQKRQNRRRRRRTGNIQVLVERLWCGQRMKRCHRWQIPTTGGGGGGGCKLIVGASWVSHGEWCRRVHEIWVW